MSPASRNVFMKSFASLVETREALAITDASRDDALAGSSDDAPSTSFISYLNGASLCVFSMDCLFVLSFVLGLPLDEFGLLFDVGGFGPAKNITPLKAYSYLI